MDERDFYMKRWEAEQPVFLKVLRALPAGQLDYKPHERSSSAGDIAWLLADELRMLIDLVDHGTIPWPPAPKPDTLDEIIAAYEKYSAELRKRFDGKLAEAWDGPAKFMMGNKVLGESTVGTFLMGFLFDAVHHRGQLSAYIRPMGGKVPSIYGPSADEMPGQG